MNSRAVWRSGIAVLFLTVLLTIAAPAANAQAKHVRWDIISISGTGVISAGGSTFATSVDGSKITLTGTGTFVAPPGSQESSDAVTGGGTWKIDKPSASGTYEVTGLVRFDEAPGTLVGEPLTDTIDDLEDTRAGLLILSILYSDGERGILVLSCTLDGTPAIVYEGVTASKGFVNFFTPVLTEGQNLFHSEE